MQMGCYYVVQLLRQSSLKHAGEGGTVDLLVTFETIHLHRAQGSEPAFCLLRNACNQQLALINWGTCVCFQLVSISWKC